MNSKLESYLLKLARKYENVYRERMIVLFDSKLKDFLRKEANDFNKHDKSIRFSAENY